MSAEDPEREELRALIGALRMEARRRADLGQGSVPRPKRGSAAPAQAAAPRTAAPPPPAEARALQAPPPPAPAPEVAVTPAPPRGQQVPSAPAAEEPATAKIARSAPDLATLAARVGECTACELCRTRRQTVFADGEPGARVMFVGEAPGAEEDRTGTPFVGRAGQLLTDIVTKGMGLERREVYIANVLKCRPPDNRDPSPAEKRLCTPFLERQIDLVDPAVIVPLGRHAAAHLLGQDLSMGRMRGRVHEARGRKLVPTYHPAYLLRTPTAKKDTWADIQLAMRELGLQIPAAGPKKDPPQG